MNRLKPLALSIWALFAMSFGCAAPRGACRADAAPVAGARRAPPKPTRDPFEALGGSVVTFDPASVPPPRGPLPVLAGSFCPAPTENAGTLIVGYEPLEGLVLPGALPDYLVLAPAPRGGTTSELGFRCRGASSREQCRGQIDATLRAPASSPLPSLLPRRLVVQRGDAVWSVSTWQELAAFLGPVDTMAEAGLHAILHGYRIACGFSTAEKRSDGWWLTALESNVKFCVQEETYGALLRLDADGGIHVVQRALLRTVALPCMGLAATARTEVVAR